MAQNTNSPTKPNKISNTLDSVKEDSIKKEIVSQRAIGRKNFMGMVIAGAMIVLGFILMLGEPSTTNEFNPDIFSTRRIVVGPMIAFLGFVLMAIALIISPSKSQNKEKA